MHYANGDKYEGTWDENKKMGKGTFTWSSDDKYIGEFDNGIKEG